MIPLIPKSRVRVTERFIASSFRDPENFACEVEGSWFRVAHERSARALRTLRSSPLYEELVERGDIAHYEEVAPEEGRRILDQTLTHRRVTDESHFSVFSVQKIDVITYPWEWPNALLLTAGQLTLDLRSRLLDIGLDLKDASAFNVQFRGSKPIFIDLGSIEVWRPNPSWNASRQFIEHFINPLAIGNAGAVSAADAWSLSRGKGVSSSVARPLMSKKLRRRPGLAVLQATTRPKPGNKPSEVRYREMADSDKSLALRATRSLTKRLLKNLNALGGSVHETTWADYGSREHYAQVELEGKRQRSRDFINSLNPSTDFLALDVGGNDGFTAEAIAAEVGCPVVVLDVDAGALDQLTHAMAGTESGALVTPLIGDITNLTPASGLLHQEFSDFGRRIRPQAVLCQAVLHHVVITQGVPLSLAAEALAGFHAPLHIEFADIEDPKVALLISQIPNWQGDYSVETLIASLELHFEDVRIVGKTTDTRIVIEARRPRTEASAVERSVV